MLINISLVLASYLLGAIPSGYLITKKIKGFDIRDHGSGNPGAANVYRVVGKWPGVITFLCDAAKGAAAVLIAKHFAPQQAQDTLAIICGFAAICAHMWTIFLKLRGGKGVATSAGVFGALLPLPTLFALITFAIVVWRTGRISPGSILAAVVLPLSSYFFGGHPPSYSILATVVGAIVIYRHIPNIKRMLNKEELKFEDGSKKI
ncbi:MAG: glycerol-3-phosphate 1-O-acyltransferase PlsY [Elusimicrobiota bacterium]|jgi:glycerol-3-phosphate acyltransferase PlsY|nr:glycerol-3-phosphate 1-O-acyltransferase PlsY [Elusimicrobiota bacterium]